MADLVQVAVSPAWRTLAALGLEALVGYPDALHRRLPHPVTWLGAALDRLERGLNQPRFNASVSSASARFATRMGTFSSRPRAVARLTSLWARRTVKSAGSSRRT